MTNTKRLFFIPGYILAIAGILLWIYSIVPELTNNPFTQSWSEGGRIFASYQMYAPIITGKYLSMPWLDPGRSILDGIVLLIPNSTILGYRVWVNTLLLIFNFLAAFLTLRRVLAYTSEPRIWKKGLFILLGLWGGLFLLQGPVYFHVLLGVIPILWFYDEKRPLRNLLIISICSIWQALCRVNWFMIPAVLAILLHVLRVPVVRKDIWQYFKWPLVYLAIGGISSFSAYLIYMKAMGFVIPFFNPKMNYPFFLYKLWPNSGYMGLLPGILLISFPILLIYLWVSWKYRPNIHWIRHTVILGILGIFFTGSTLISLRAGGGYDLHNYDTLLLLLFIIGCFFGTDAVNLDKAGRLEKPPLTNNAVLILILIIPVFFAFPKTEKTNYQTNEQSEQTLQDIRQVILQNSQGSNINHPILFIDQRQLLVFNLIEDQDIFVPYEKIELMEMAMARNEEYKRQFKNDMENHRYSLIISEVLVPWAKSFTPDFFDRDWYENNVWVEYVSIPVLENYTPIYSNKEVGVAIYAPKN